MPDVGIAGLPANSLSRGIGEGAGTYVKGLYLKVVAAATRIQKIETEVLLKREAAQDRGC
jgi:hypothetical protein